MEPRSYNILGSVAIVNFSDDITFSEKKKFAQKIMENNKVVKTVLEKSGNFKGRLRKMQTKHLAGEKTKEVLYRENGCVFRFDVDETYFSPRLSHERNEVASMIKKGEEVFVMFAGVGPFSIVIAKNSPVKKVVSNEINRVANKYAKLNVELNNVKDKVEIVPGDVKRVAKKLNLEGRKFSTIVMPRPRLKDSFLPEAFMLSKKGTKIIYYDFTLVEEIDKIVEKIKDEAKKAKKDIKILNLKRAGEIAPYKIRVRVDFIIL